VNPPLASFGSAFFAILWLASPLILFLRKRA
jgi:hypothetical protein